MSNMVVRTNILAHNSHRNLGLVGNMQARASERLSSGFRINRAADDAAGLAISEGMRAQIRGMAQASRNALDGISLMQTAEGFTNTIQEITQRVRELALQGANDNYSVVQRGHIMTEVTQLINETMRIHSEARFNGQNLFASGTPVLMEITLGSINAATGEQVSGTVSVGGEAATGTAALLQGSFFLQIGADGGAVPGNGSLDIAVALGTETFNTALEDFVTAVGDADTLSAEPAGEAHEGFREVALAADTFNNAIGTFRANLGAVQNRLEFTIENLDIARENLSASESRIRDADMALEMMRLTQANVLQQAATAMLAQGNMAPQSILQLLG